MVKNPPVKAVPVKKASVKATPVKATPVKESKTDRFNRLGTKRVESVLRSLRILGNCSSRNNYEYTQEQVDKISTTLVKALEQTIVKFHNVKKTESFEF